MIEDDERGSGRWDSLKPIDPVRVVIPQKLRDRGQEFRQLVGVDGFRKVRFHHGIHVRIITQ